MLKRIYVLFTIVIVILSSCDHSEFSDFDKAKSGLLYKIHTRMGEKKAKPGDYLTVEMVYTTNEDSLLFDSNGETFPLKLEEPVFSGDINDALAMLGKGDSATFVIRADSFLIRNARLTQLPSFVTDKSKMIFYVKLHNVQTLEELQQEEAEKKAQAEKNEKQIIANYIQENHIAIEPSSTGVYFILRKQGHGKKAEIGKMVKVHYIGKFLDGTKFDSSYDRDQPARFQLGMGNVIDGWDEAIQKMHVGDEATLIIPSSMGYKTGRAQIPPYTPLLFEVKLIDVN